MISRIFFLVFLTSILFTAGIFLTVNAQFPGNNSGGNSQNDLTSTIIPKKSIGVRISSPITGDQIFINGTNYFNTNGEKLSILGTSLSNTNSSSTCFVSIIVNSVKPYQLANGTGPKGNSDYSSWKYTFSPLYLPLIEGSNKITSKLTCEPGNLVAYYSVSVTSSIFNGTFPSTFANADNAPINATTTNIAPAPSSPTTLPLNSTTPITTTPLVIQSKSFNNNNAPINATTTNIAPALSSPITSTPLTLNSMSITIDKKEIGKIQTIVMTVTDTITGKPIGGVFLTGNINNEPFSGITNSSGEFNKVIPSKVIKSFSTVDVTVTATSDGYKTNKASTTFDIASTSTSTSKAGTNTNTNTNTNGKSGAKDMASKIAKDVQNQLSKQGINIPLPFG